MNSSKPPLTQRLQRKVARAARDLRFRRSVRQVSGPARLDQGADDVTVIGLVRDGLYYLDAYLDHHRSLGARHFVFCDNGSTDGTLDRLAAEPGVVVLQCTLPMADIENDFRRLAADRFCRDRWCLYVDMDEMFGFAGQESLGLNGLVGYLTQRGFTAMVAQMLDMFPRAPLLSVQDMGYRDVLGQFEFYDLRDLSRVAYHDADLPFAYYLAANTAAPGVDYLFGGIRRRVFGENCCLTKQPLVFVGPGVTPGVHPHCAMGVRVADVTGLLRHYKFTNGFNARDAASVAENAIPHGEDRLRQARTDADLTLWSAGARRYDGPDQLYAEGFLTRSVAFDRYLDA